MFSLKIRPDGDKLKIPLVLLALCFGTTGPLLAQTRGTEAPPYIPTPLDLVDLMLDMAELSPDDVLYDLGSGDGRLVIEAAARGAEAVGIEYDQGLVELSREKADRAGLSGSARFRRADLFGSDLSPASVIVMYLSPEFNLRLRPLLLRELRPGSRIVSHAFHMGDWAPDLEVAVGEGVARATLYRWVVPADVDGFWSLEASGMRPITLELRQRFQVIEGTASMDGISFVVTDGTIRGDVAEFTLTHDGPSPRSIVFSGRLAGGRIVGQLRSRGDQILRHAAAIRFTDSSRAPS